jgi:hypothetical protein
MVDQAVAAAACGFKLERFRALCPVRPFQEGRRLLVPLDEVRAWAKGYWRSKTEGTIADVANTDSTYWLYQLEPGAEED